MATERPDRNYDSRDLNKWFAIGSLVLLVVTLLMVADDYSRQWKDFQRQFHRLEAGRTQREIREAEKALKSADMKKLEAELKQALGEIEQRRSEYDKALKALERLDADFYGKDLDYRFAKANYDSKKYETELQIEHLRAQKKLKEADARQAELDAVKKTMDDTRVALEAVTTQQDTAKAEVARLAGRLDDIEARKKKMEVTRDRLQKKLATVEPGFVTWLVNAPMLDFMAPTLQVQQVVLPKLRHDINFMEIPRVDRCMTCHTVIDKPGYEKGAQPFRTHPNLKLYVDPGSKHPMENFGCTACHGGRDRGTSFNNAAHTPDNEKQEKEWKDKYDWEAMHYWETPMRSRSHFFAGCYQCHSQEAGIAEAAPLDRGLRILEVSGCYGCHQIKGFEKLRKGGPDLDHIASKTDKNWVFRWIRDPRSFRTSARMPSFFLQSNQQEGAVGDRPSDRELNDAEIEGIVTYIWDKATPIKYDPVSRTGDPQKGKELVQNIGCLGCHTDDPKETFPDRAQPRAFGPNLAGLGSKTSQTWLFHWLKDPKHYWKDAFMPNLRLSDQEALDVSSYLLSQRNADFDKIQVPAISAKARDWMTREYLSARMSLAATDAKMKTMTEMDKKLYLGEKMINKYGCFGCHQIKGFENTQPIGTELTEEGSKLVTRLDFGLEETLEHTLPAWMRAKLENPRRFDRGKIKTWDEKLKMPNFHLNKQEITDLVTVIQGFSKARMDTDMRPAVTAQRAAIEEGRRIIRDHNCTACHIIGKQGGAIRAKIKDPGYFPPSLDGEGEKVIPVWLFTFLKGPTTVRPWLNVRMPTFGLNDHETVAISRMFANLDKAEYPFESEYFKLEPATPDLLAGGSKLFTDFKCLQCHFTEQGKTERDAADLAPNLSLARSRLRPAWIEKWLRDPQALQPGTRMPAYFPDMKSPDPQTLGGDAALQIKALKYHVLGLGPKAPPVTTGNE
jgi:mono/diheme cytochrome c family protein